MALPGCRLRGVWAVLIHLPTLFFELTYVLFIELELFIELSYELSIELELFIALNHELLIELSLCNELSYGLS